MWSLSAWMHQGWQYHHHRLNKLKRLVFWRKHVKHLKRETEVLNIFCQILFGEKKSLFNELHLTNKQAKNIGNQNFVLHWVLPSPRVHLKCWTVKIIDVSSPFPPKNKIIKHFVWHGRSKVFIKIKTYTSKNTEEEEDSFLLPLALFSSLRKIISSLHFFELYQTYEPSTLY